MILSIIVPVYNAEQYIHTCIESIYKQGLKEEDFEVILVNDGTTDKSFLRIEDFIKVHDNITIINQPNQGPSVARNTGIEKAHGEYILFPDSDDIIISNTLLAFLKIALESQADMIVGDFLKINSNNISSYVQPAIEHIYHKQKKGTEFFLNDFNSKECFVWRTLYRKDFLNEKKIRFIPGIYFEDIPFTVECYLNAKKCEIVSLPFYIYRQRENSIVASINMKKLQDMNAVIAHLHSLKKEYNANIEKKIDDVIFSTFSIAIWYIAHNKELLDQRNLYIKDIKGRIPHLKLSNSFKQQIISLFFHLAPNIYIKLCSYNHIIRI